MEARRRISTPQGVDRIVPMIRPLYWNRRSALKRERIFNNQIQNDSAPFEIWCFVFQICLGFGFSPRTVHTAALSRSSPLASPLSFG
jgi:hypothetical protein